MKNAFDFKEQWNFVKPIWRILVSILILQLAGALYFLNQAPYHHPLIDFWFGGMIATLPGFILGLAWHIISAQTTIKEDILAIGFVAFLCLLLTSVAVSLPLHEIAASM